MDLPDKDRLFIESAIRDKLSGLIPLKDYKIFFFGSRVSGKSRGSSDIDIGILKNDGSPLPPGVSSALQEFVRDLPVLYKIDFVDFGSANKDFKAVALSEIESFSS